MKSAIYVIAHVLMILVAGIAMIAFYGVLVGGLAWASVAIFNALRALTGV